MIFTFELYELTNRFVGNRDIEASNENEATEKLEVALAEEGENLEYDLVPTLAQVCADIEAQEALKDEQFMDELAQLEEECTGCENGCDQCLDPLMCRAD